MTLLASDALINAASTYAHMNDDASLPAPTYGAQRKQINENKITRAMSSMQGASIATFGSGWATTTG